MQIKGILKKANIDSNTVSVGKTTIAISDITEIKYQMATALLQGFITFCTETEGLNVNTLEEAAADKNSITFYKKQNDNVEEIIEFFSDKATITDTTGIHPKKAISPKKEKAEKFKAEAKELEARDEIFCPKCHSTNVFYDKKKFSLGRAVVGSAFLGGLGAVAGGLSSKKIEFKCLKCGHTWTK